MQSKPSSRHVNPESGFRYSRQDVALVPLWEWRFLKRLEAAIKAGRTPWEEGWESDAE